MFVCGGSFLAILEFTLSFVKKGPDKNRKPDNSQPRFPQLKHLQRLLKNSKHTNEKSRSLLVYSGEWLFFKATHHKKQYPPLGTPPVNQPIKIPTSGDSPPAKINLSLQKNNIATNTNVFK